MWDIFLTDLFSLDDRLKIFNFTFYVGLYLGFTEFWKICFHKLEHEFCLLLSICYDFPMTFSGHCGVEMNIIGNVDCHILGSVSLLWSTLGVNTFETWRQSANITDQQTKC